MLSTLCIANLIFGTFFCLYCTFRFLMRLYMKQIVYENQTKNFRISHIVRNSSYDMNKRHIHKEYELYYLIKGERYYFIDSQTYHITPNSLVLIPSGTLHRTLNVNANEGHERILLIVNEEWINPFLHNAGLPPLSSYFHQPVIHFDEFKQKYVCQLFDNIYQEVATKQTNYEVSIKLKLSELLILISRCRNTTTDISAPFVSQSSKHQKVNEATYYIKEHFCEPISLQQVAEHVFVSRGYLSNIFNEVTGMKLTEYVNLQRINYAKELLANSSESITTIANNCGFENITYFERIFRQVTGDTPLKYRQSLKSS